MNKYDVFGLSQLIDRGLSHKLDLIESAINKLDSALEPITIVESYAFVANTSNGELYRFQFSLDEGNVSFSNPQRFELDPDTSRFERKSKKIIRDIVESISEDNEADTEYFKAQWLANQRQKNLLESKLNVTVGTRSGYIKTAKQVVSEAIKIVRGAKSLMVKGKKESLFSKLISEGEVVVTAEAAPREIGSDQSRKQLIYQHVVEIREKAKGLLESPVFTEYAFNIYEDIDVEDSVEFIAENYQELFALSLSEQTELIYAVVESKQSDKPELDRTVNTVMAIGNYAVNDEHISEELNKLSTIIGATNGNYHERMQLIEDEINTRTFTNNDINILTSVLEQILAHPSEFLAPEFITECRRVFGRVQSMVESGNIDDAVISSAIHLISQFYPQTIKESKDNGYKEFFNKKLEKFGVKSPSELSDADKKKFFAEVEKEWTSEDEKGKAEIAPEEFSAEEDEDKTIYNEGVDPQTGFPKGILEALSDKEEEDQEEDEDEIVDLKKKMEDAESMEDLDAVEKEMKKAKKKAKGKEKEDIEDMEDELATKKLTAK